MPMIREVSPQPNQEPRLPPERPGRPLPRAANDNTPRAANDNIPIGEVARRLGIPLARRLAPRFVPYVNALSLAYDLGLFDDFKDALKRFADALGPYDMTQGISGNWRVVSTCASIGGPNLGNMVEQGWSNASSLTCGNGLPYGGYPGTTPWVTFPRGAFQSVLSDTRIHLCVGVCAQPHREIDAVVYQKINTALSNYAPWPFPTVEKFNALDPNITRGMPGQAPQPSPQYEPAVQPDIGPSEWAWSSNPSAGQQVRPHLRQPPPRGTVEVKTKSLSARIGLWLYRALDNVSEKAEIIDALFDALPPDVRKRWSKDREKRYFVDTMGQYGIDGADWKLEALYYNRDKIDMTVALKNIVKNYVEDEIIGGVQKHLPKNTVNALVQKTIDEDGDFEQKSFELALSSFVDELFEDI